MTRHCVSATLCHVNRKTWLYVGLALLLIAVALVVAFSRSASHRPSTNASKGSGDSEAQVTDPTSPTASMAPITSTVHDRKVRDEVRTRIYANRGEQPPDTGGVLRNAGVAPPPPRIAPDDPTNLALDREYIRDVVRSDFYPMAKQCYESALAANPTLAGKIVLDFTIVGDAKIGGIVESAKIDPDSTIQDPRLLECFSESLMAVAFKPPTKGGKLTVKYPISLSPDEPDAGQRRR